MAASLDVARPTPSLPTRPATVLCLALSLVSAMPLARAETSAEAAATKRAAVFEEAADLVRDNFYDKTLRGLDWSAARARHRPAYVAATTPAARSAAINSLLAELDASHMFHFTPEDPAYYQLADIFQNGLRRDLPKHFPGGEVSYPGIGIFSREIEGKIFVTGVIAGQPGDKAGLKTGDEIVSVAGRPFQPVASFRNRVDRPVAMTVRRERAGPELTLEVRPATLKPAEMFDAAIRDGARVIETGGKRIGYVRIWSYASIRYQTTLEELLSTGPLKDVDALVWDLRDGWGGAQPRYLDLFNDKAPDMTFTERDGKPSYVSFRWRRPVAVLINGGTRSGKEVLTYGFKKYGRGEVVGTRTAGALLAGRGYLLSDGTFLMVAVNDVAVDGERLEAKGVEPTVEVPFEVPYAAGRDPQLDRAVELLTGARG